MAGTYNDLWRVLEEIYAQVELPQELDKAVSEVLWDDPDTELDREMR